MASSNIFSSAPSVSMEFRPYIPPTPNSNPRCKARAKAKAKTSTAEYNHSGVSFSKDNGEYFHIDDLSMPDSNASHSPNLEVPALFGPEGASCSPAHDMVTGFGAASGPGRPERCQINEELLDEGGMYRVASMAKINLAPNGLIGKSSLESPSILESDRPEERYNTMRIEPSSEASTFEEKVYQAATSTERQHGDFGAANTSVLSEESMDYIFHKQMVVGDEPYFDATIRSPLTGKRTRTSSGGITTSLAEVPDITSELELEDSRSAKRQRLPERQANNSTLDDLATSEITPLSTSKNSELYLEASHEPIARPPSNHRQNDSAKSLNIDKDKSEDIENAWNIVEQPLYLTSTLEREEDERDRIVSDNKAGGTHEDELDEAPSVSAKTLKLSKRSDSPIQRRHAASQAVFGRNGQSAMLTSTPQNVSSAQPYQILEPGANHITQPCFLQASSPETSVGNEINTGHGLSTAKAHQIVELTRCCVPRGPSIVTAIVRYNKPGLFPNPKDLEHEILKEEGKAIRIMQLSPDSWMLLGYQYDDDALGSLHGSKNLANADGVGSHYNGDISHDTESREGSFEEYKNGEDEHHSDKPGNKRWLPSDEARLLSYKDKMKMGWDEIFTKFSGRSQGAIKTRYYMLRKDF